MTPWQVVVLAVGGVWVGWLIVRLLLLWSRVARQGVARAVAPGRPTLRLEFPPSVWLEIMEGPRLGWLAEDLAGVIDELSEAPPTLRLAGGYRSVKQRARDGLVLTEEWDDKAETCGHWVRPGPYVRRAEPPTAAEARAAGVEL